MTDFFLSYNLADRSWAEWIAWQLEDAGYTVVIQAWDFRPGGNFVLDMRRAADATRTIAVLSPKYLAAEYTQPEWATAFGQDPQGLQGKLLPVRVQNCDIPPLLRAIIYIDLVGLDETRAKEALLRGINRSRAKPSVPPGFPASAASHGVDQNPPMFPPSSDATPSVEQPSSYVDQRRGTFISGGTVYGPVIGDTSGTITTSYTTSSSSGSDSSPSHSAVTAADKVTLRNLLTQKFSEDDLQILCFDVQEALAQDGIQLQVNLEIVGGSSKPTKVLNLIQFLERRGYLEYLVTAIRRSRQG